MSIYLRDLKKNCIFIRNKIKISSFIPDGLGDLIEKNVPQNHYILGVTYSTHDCQICISGHPKGEETLMEGTLREMSEELSLTSLKEVRPLFQRDMNHYYCLSLFDLKLYQNNSTCSERDLKDRAVVCVHAPERDILYYLSKVGYNHHNDDGIVSIWATSRENILSYIHSSRSGFMSPMSNIFSPDTKKI